MPIVRSEKPRGAEVYDLEKQIKAQRESGLIDEKAARMLSDMNQSKAREWLEANSATIVEIHSQKGASLISGDQLKKVSEMDPRDALQWLKANRALKNLIPQHRKSNLITESEQEMLLQMDPRTALDWLRARMKESEENAKRQDYSAADELLKTLDS